LEKAASKHCTLESRAEEYGSAFADYIVEHHIRPLLDELNQPPSPPSFSLRSKLIKALIELGAGMYMWNHKVRTACVSVDLFLVQPPANILYDPRSMQLGGQYMLTGSRSVVVAPVGMGLMVWVTGTRAAGVIQGWEVKAPIVTEEYFRQ
jgi:hypothetical protein